MATKTIRLKRATLHVAADGFKPYEFGQIGQVIGGNYKIKEIPPGTPVNLEAAEADRILETYDGEIVSGRKEPVIVPSRKSDDDSDAGKKGRDGGDNGGKGE